jgi:uncharacterized lipoprotein YmbA
MNHTQKSVIGLLLVTLVGCASSTKSIKYYSLDLNSTNGSSEASIATKDAKNQSPLVEVAPIELPSFLNQGGLIIQLGEHELVTANYHRWAEPLDKAISRLLVKQLSKQNKSYRFERSAFNLRGNKQFQLKIEINKFHATDQATVITSGRFIIYDSKSQRIAERRFSINKPLSKDGYLHSVGQLKITIEQLATLITESFDH